MSNFKVLNLGLLLSLATEMNVWATDYDGATGDYATEDYDGPGEGVAVSARAETSSDEMPAEEYIQGFLASNPSFISFFNKLRNAEKLNIAQGIDRLIAGMPKYSKAQVIDALTSILIKRNSTTATRFQEQRIPASKFNSIVATAERLTVGMNGINKASIIEALADVSTQLILTLFPDELLSLNTAARYREIHRIIERHNQSAPEESLEYGSGPAEGVAVSAVARIPDEMAAEDMQEIQVFPDANSFFDDSEKIRIAQRIDRLMAGMLWMDRPKDYMEALQDIPTERFDAVVNAVERLGMQSSLNIRNLQNIPTERFDAVINAVKKLGISEDLHLRNEIDALVAIPAERFDAVVNAVEKLTVDMNDITYNGDRGRLGIATLIKALANTPAERFNAVVAVAERLTVGMNKLQLSMTMIVLSSIPAEAIPDLFPSTLLMLDPNERYREIRRIIELPETQMAIEVAKKREQAWYMKSGWVGGVARASKRPF